MKKYFQLREKSLTDLGVVSQKELWEKIKSEGYEGLMAEYKTVFTKADKPNTYHFIFSTADRDRHDDIVLQNWDLKSFKKNPVLLDSHNYGSIFNVLGKVIKIEVKDGVLQGDVVFNPHTLEGKVAELMVEDEFISATSVGFMPLDFGKKGEIIKSELLEQSLVSVPANAKALREKQYEEDNEDVEEVDESADEPTEETNEEPIEEDVEEVAVEEEKAVFKIKRQIENIEQRKKEIFKRLEDEIKRTYPLSVAEKKRKLFKLLRQQLSKDIS